MTTPTSSPSLLPMFLTVTLTVTLSPGLIDDGLTTRSEYVNLL